MRIKWDIDKFNYNSQVGVCGTAPDGRRWAARFNLRNVNASKKIDEAKQIIRRELESGGGIAPKNMVEGNELAI